MTDNQTDSDQTQDTPSSENGDSKGSADVAKLLSAFESFTKRLDEVDERTKALQGDKDRGVNKTRKEVEQLKQQIAEIEKFKKNGLSEDEAYDEVEFRRNLSDVKDTLRKLVEAQTPTAGNGKGEGEETAKVFSEKGLDLKDPRVALELSRKYGSPAEMELAAYKLKEALASTPNPNPAQAASAKGGTGSAALSAQQIEELSGQRNELFKHKTANREELARIEKQLTEAGVPLS